MTTKKSTAKTSEKKAEVKKTSSPTSKPAVASAKKASKIAKSSVVQSSGGPRLKPSMHPKYRIITVEETDGSTFTTRSTYPGDILKLEISKKDHPAWNKGSRYASSNSSEVAKFKDKFGDLGF